MPPAFRRAAPPSTATFVPAEPQDVPPPPATIFDRAAHLPPGVYRRDTVDKVVTTRTRRTEDFIRIDGPPADPGRGLAVFYVAAMITGGLALAFGVAVFLTGIGKALGA